VSEPWFCVGQRILCVDASPNRRCAVIPLKRGRIYIVRAIDRGKNVRWEKPGWGVHREGIWIVHPDDEREWAMKPGRFRAVVERPTDIAIFKKLLAPTQLRLPLEEE
jgi:hypothetical protein